MSIEKFSGQFKNEAKGVTILVNSTVEKLKDIEALGLYVYLSTKPDTWKIHYRDIMRHFNIGKDKAYRLLNTLMEEGLLSRTEVREKGRFKQYVYMLYIKPICTESPCPENPETVRPEGVKPETYKEKNIQNKECSGADPTTTTSFCVLEMFRAKQIPVPSTSNPYVDRVVARASEQLANHGFTLEGYLDYLTNECGQWVYEPHNGRVNDFFVILRPLNIEKGCNGKFEDRL
jgi:predicted DNA-binding transcriptional regulator